MGSHSSKIAEVPFVVSDRINPPEFFFHPNRIPVILTKIKKIKRLIPVNRCNFRNKRSVLACCWRFFKFSKENV